MRPAELTNDWRDKPHDLTNRAQPRRILIVDDSKMQRKTLSVLLSRWNYQVTEAESADQALELAKSHIPDFILSDWIMPGMSGLELCESYRALGLEKYGYFILLTSRAEKADVAQAMERGADDFLAKPTNAVELRGRLAAGERILEMQAEAAHRNLQLADTVNELRLVNQAFDRDLQQAQRLQQSLVPERHRKLTGADLSLLLRQSGHVGGDLVGMFRISDTRIGLYAIDVAGHGIASALMTARLASYLTSYAPEQNVALTIDDMGIYSMRPPDEVCDILNRVISADFEAEHYFTCFLGEFDLRSGELSFAQAGHPNPIALRKSGELEVVGGGGMPIGLVADAKYDAETIELAPGDRLVIYSDGITECPDDGGDFLGEDGLAELIRHNAPLRGQAFIDGLTDSLIGFAGTPTMPDDVSAILLERAV